MEELRYEYSLRLQFSQPAWNHRFFLRAFPLTDERQHLFGQRIEISPHRFLRESRDSFGNLCFYGAAEAQQEQFLVEVTGYARAGLSPGVPEPHPERWRVMKYSSPYTRPGPYLLALARQLPTRSETHSPLERSLQLMEAVYSALSYQQWVTGVQTTAEEALTLGAGVCQDYAHILLALCRLEGIPARYVVGMLQGEGASHAWVEVLSQGRWYGLDPTNLLRVEDQHIKISCGRDYGDCIMNQGVFLGGGTQTQTVRVSVSPCIIPPEVGQL
ncbi:MAG: transglutaminase domain-containing protein [Candidatus Onthomonas sp.]